MSRASLVLLIMIGVLYISMTVAQRQCPRNQEWTNCGSACPPACNQPRNRVCTLQCVVGCQCRNGYLQNSAGQCVPPSRC